MGCWSSRALLVFSHEHEANAQYILPVVVRGNRETSYSIWHLRGQTFKKKKTPQSSWVTLKVWVDVIAHGKQWENLSSWISHHGHACFGSLVTENTRMTRSANRQISIREEKWSAGSENWVFFPPEWQFICRPVRSDSICFCHSQLFFIWTEWTRKNNDLTSLTP